MWKQILLAVLLPISISTVAAEELTPEKRSDIEHLISVSGAKEVAQRINTHVLDRIPEQLRRSRPGVPQRALEIMRHELHSFLQEKLYSPGGIIDQQAPIFHAHFSHEEIRSLIAFYETPLGRKLAQEQPAITSEALRFTESAITQLLPQLNARITEALKREGIDVGR